MSTHRKLAEQITTYRIGDAAGTWPIFSAEGARQVSGRWHQSGDAVVYTSLHYSTAMLEKLVHWNGSLPPNQHFIEITLPAGLSYEVAGAEALDGWHRSDGEVARRFGHDWFSAGRSAVLFVPSVVARMERNVLLNTGHSEFAGIKPGLETPVWWDARLFA